MNFIKYGLNIVLSLFFILNTRAIEISIMDRGAKPDIFRYYRNYSNYISTLETKAKRKFKLWS